VASIVFDLIGRDKGASAAVKGLAKAADEAATKLHGVSTSMRTGLTTAAKAATIALAGAGAAAVAFGVKTAANMQQAEIAFTTMLGSAQKARTFLGQLQKFAAATPFEFPDLVRSSQRLIAMGVAAKDVIPYLTGIGDAVAGLGGSRDQIDQVTTAIGQMAAKGKIQSDELLQLTEAGIPALKILAAQYHVSAARMQDMVTKGKVLSDDALPKLIAGLEHGTSATQSFGGMMAKQSKSLTGLWSTLKDTVSTALGNMVVPFIPAITAGLNALSSLSTKAGGGLRDFFAGIAHGFRDTRAAAKGVDQALKSVGAGMSAVTEGAKPLTGLIANIGAGAQGAAQALEPVGQIFNDTTVPMGQFVGSIKPLGALLKTTGKDAETSGLAKFGYVLGTGLANLVLWIERNKGALAALGNALVVAGQAIAVAAAWVRGTAVPALVEFWSTLQRRLWPILQVIGHVIATVLVPAFKFLAQSVAENKPVLGALLQVGKVLAILVGVTLVASLGLVVAAFAAVSIAAGILVRWWGLLVAATSKVWEATQRLGSIFSAVWGAIKATAKTAIAEVVRTFLNMVDWIIRGAAKAFGWVPNIGPKLRAAAKDFADFKTRVNTELGGVKSRTVVITAKVLASAATPAGSGGGAGRSRAMAAGGRLPGYGGGDIVPAMLEPGEAVIPKHLVPSIAGWARGAGIPGFRAGGLVPAGDGRLHLAAGGLVPSVHTSGLSAFGKAMDAFNARLTAMAVRLGRTVASSMIVPGLGGVPSSVSGNAAIVQRVFAQMFGWTGPQWAAAYKLIMGESGFHNTAQNPTSTAYGMFQFLNGTWGGVGGRKTSDPTAQAIYGGRYIQQRYGSPAGAYSAWSSRSPHWYDAGGWLPPGVSLAVNNTGRAERILPPGAGGGAAVVVNINGAVGDQRAVINWVRDGVREALRREGRTSAAGTI
jgi:tape measure domain-containing protein